MKKSKNFLWALIADKINLSVDSKHSISVIRIVENLENKSVLRCDLIREI